MIYLIVRHSPKDSNPKKREKILSYSTEKEKAKAHAKWLRNWTRRWNNPNTSTWYEIREVPLIGQEKL